MTQPYFDCTSASLSRQGAISLSSLDPRGQNPTKAADLSAAGGDPGIPGSPEAVERPAGDPKGISAGRSSLPWTRKQKRCYQRVRSVLRYWLSNGYQVLWVCLTSAPDSDADKLAYHHQILRQRIEREFGYHGLEHFQVRTNEGHGVLHIFWAWKEKRPGFRSRSFYIPQDWLSRAWEEIHGAKIVWICRLKNSKKSVKAVSAYAVSQYCAEQNGFQRMSWSWKRTFGFPMVRMWEFFKLRYRNFPLGLAVLQWEAFLSGAVIMFCDGSFTSLGVARRFYEKQGGGG